VSQTQARRRKATANGTPNFIQVKKSMAGASGKIAASWDMKIPFGGVPMIVAMPPMLAA